MGYYHLLDLYLKGVAATQPDSLPELSEFQYQVRAPAKNERQRDQDHRGLALRAAVVQAAWRTSQWSLDTKQAQVLEGKELLGFHMGVYHALRYLVFALFLCSCKS